MSDGCAAFGTTPPSIARAPGLADASNGATATACSGRSAEAATALVAALNAAAAALIAAALIAATCGGAGFIGTGRPGHSLGSTGTTISGAAASDWGAFTGEHDPSQQIAGTVVVDDAIRRLAHDIEVNFAAGGARRRHQRTAETLRREDADEHGVALAAHGPGAEKLNPRSDPPVHGLGHHRGFIQLPVDRVRNRVTAGQQLRDGVSDLPASGGGCFLDSERLSIDRRPRRRNCRDAEHGCRHGDRPG